MNLKYFKQGVLVDSKFNLKSLWKYFIIGLIGILYFISWEGLIKGKYIPVNRNLLIGERLVGRASTHIEPAIPILSPYGYDSQFFWALSLDPLLQNNQIKESIDAPAYRSQRILLPLLTWCLRLNPVNIIYGLWFWNLMGYLAGCLGIYKLCLHFSISSPIPMIFYAFNPGVIIALIYPMSDVLGSGLFLLGLAFWIADRNWISCILFMAACLAREFTAVFVFFVAIFSYWNTKIIHIRKLIPLAISVIPMIIWQIIIRWNHGAWAPSQARRGLDWPFVGIFKTLLTESQNHLITKTKIGAICLDLVCIVILFNIYRVKKNLILFLTVAGSALTLVNGSAIMESDWAYMRSSILFISFVSISLMIVPSKSIAPAHA